MQSLNKVIRSLVIVLIPTIVAYVIVGAKTPDEEGNIYLFKDYFLAFKIEYVNDIAEISYQLPALLILFLIFSIIVYICNLYIKNLRNKYEQN